MTYHRSFLTKPQTIEKFQFLTRNMLKNMLSKNPDGFREKCVRRFGRRLLLDEQALIEFLDAHRG